MSVIPAGAWTVAAGPSTNGVPAATWSAVIPPLFEIVWDTVNSVPTFASAGAVALAPSEAGKASTTRNTPSTVPLPYGPWTESAYVPGGTLAGTVASRVLEPTHRTSCSCAGPTKG